MPSYPPGMIPGTQRQAAPPSILQAASHHKLILVSCTLLGLCAAVLYWRFMPRTYQATAEVAVQSKRTDLVTGVNNQDSGREDYVAAQMARLRSPILVERAVQQSKLDLLPSLAGQSNPTEAVLRSLAITRGRGQFGENNLLSLAVRTRYAEDCPIILEALLGAHRHWMATAYENETTAALRAILQARDNVQKQLRQTEAAYATFRKAHPLANKGASGISPLRQRLDGIQAKRSALLLRRVELQSRLQGVQAAQKTGQSPETVLAMLAGASGDTALDGGGRDRLLVMQEQLAPLLQEEQKLLGSYGPNHPDVQAVRQRIRAVRTLFARPTPTWTDGQAADPVADAVTRHVAALRQKLQELNTTDTILADQEQKTSQQLAETETQDEAYRTELARTGQLYDGIVKRVEEVRLAKDVGGYEVQVISPPSVPQKIAPSALLVLPTGLFLGLFGGIGLAYRLSSRDDRLRDAEDVGAHFGLPVLGTVPWIKTARPALRTEGQPATHPLVLAVCQPESAEAEAFRLLRTALFCGSGQDRRVLQVTSPVPEDGKSLLAANLAAAMAQAGKQVVLVDANLRSPSVERLFGLPANPGLAGVLKGMAEPSETIQSSGVPGLSILAAGARPANPAELLTSRAFADLLRWLRERADFVIVDSPALSGVADAAVIAARADGVLLAWRVDRDTRANADRAMQRLATVQANVLGVVLNGGMARDEAAALPAVRNGRHPPGPPWPEAAAIETVARDGSTAGNSNGTA